MLTAKDGEYDQTDAFDLGADDYLTSRSRSSCWWPGCARWCAGPRRNARRS